MPRIRTLKPEHRQHRKVGRLTDRQYRLWVGLILEADDHGRFVADLEQLTIAVFGYHREVTPEITGENLKALDRSGLVRLYQVDGVPYGDFPSWRDHQWLSHPKPSKLPPYEEDQGIPATSGDDRIAPGLARARRSDQGSRIKDQGSERNTRSRALAASAPAEFEEFWLAYPRKVGKGAALKAWRGAAAKDAHEVILAGLHRQRESMAGQEERYIPYPATWLNQERWKDEPPAVNGNPFGKQDMAGLQRFVERGE